MRPSIHARRRLALVAAVAALGSTVVAPGSVAANSVPVHSSPHLTIGLHDKPSARHTASSDPQSKHNLALSAGENGSTSAPGGTLPSTTHAPQPRSLSGSGTVAGRAFNEESTYPVRQAVGRISGDIATTPSGNGYWTLAFDGSLKPFGDAQYFGSPINDFPQCGHWSSITSDVAGPGYWILSELGCVVRGGGAPGYGDVFTTPSGLLVTIRPTSTGHGYYVVDENGAVFPFGDAVSHGDLRNLRLNRPITSMDVTPDGGGYWLVASDGGIFPFGDASGHGSTGNIQTDGAIFDIRSTATGQGYWEMSSHGVLYPFGDAVNYGDRSGQGNLIEAMAPTADRKGYWMLRFNGQVFPFGDANSGLVGDTGIVVGDFGSSDSNATAGDFTVTVDWGDGTVEPGRVDGIGGFVATTAPHAYARDGYYARTVEIRSTAGDDLIGQGLVVITPADGYWLGAADGGIFPFGDMQGYGSHGGSPLNKPIVGMAMTPTGLGYWLVASDGGIFPYGDAVGYGSHGGSPLNKPIVGMAATPDGGGYWLVASDGGIFPYGDAVGYGSHGGSPLNKPIVGMAALPDGSGYWLVASDGGIFPYGHAYGWGSHGGSPLNKPIVGMAVAPFGFGYWLVASDGGIFPYGFAAGWGSHGGSPLNQPIVGMAATPDGGGYWLVASDGGIFPYGDAPGMGSLGGTHLNQPIVGMVGV